MSQHSHNEKEAKGVTVKSLGQTISGREIDCITCGNGPNVCWVIHRQHPGEFLRNTPFLIPYPSQNSSSSLITITSRRKYG